MGWLMTTTDTLDTLPVAQTAQASAPPQTPYRLIPPRGLVAVVQRFIAEGRPIGLDVEATGLDPWTNKLICVQVGDARGASIVDMRHTTADDRASLADTMRLLFSGRVEVVGHNLKFDILTLAVHLGIGPDELQALRLYDTMIAEQVILGGADAVDGSGRERANLAATAVRYGLTITKDPRSWFAGLDTPDRQAEWAAPLPPVTCWCCQRCARARPAKLRRVTWPTPSR
jgi:3'-5' exonuclease